MSLKKRRVAPEEIRQRFNSMGLAKQAEDGTLMQILERESPARPQANQPTGTRSRMVWYVDSTMTKVALVHEYRLTDGTIGGSGKPDPKRLVVGDEVLYC